MSEGTQSKGSDGNGYFINTSNQNGYLANFFWDYGQNFTVLRLNSDDGSISGETYSNFSWDYSDQMITQDSIIFGSLYGSELQGLGLTIDDGRTSSNLTPSNEIFKQINTAYLKENRELYVPTSGTSTMQGYLQGVGLNINSSLALSEPITTSSNPFEFSVDKATGSFTTTSTSYTMNTSNENLQSYYVDDSKFGSLFTEMTQGAYTLIPLKSSWFFTIPDTLNEDSATYSYDNDDYSSWGYWTATLQDSNNDLLQYTNSSTWVAGVTTPTETIDFLLSTSKPTYTFNGQVLGNVVNGTTFTPIDLNNQNNISLTIDFNTASVSGSLGFTANSNTWNANITTSSVTNSNFTASLEGRVGVDDTAGSLEGKYYGLNLQSVGGKFNLLNTTTGIETASGVFKAKKPLPTN